MQKRAFFGKTQLIHHPFHRPGIAFNQHREIGTTQMKQFAELRCRLFQSISRKLHQQRAHIKSERLIGMLKLADVAHENRH